MTDLQQDSSSPDFRTWNPFVLADFAKDAFHQMKNDAGTIEQLRLDLKDAMKLARLNYKDDWK